MLVTASHQTSLRLRLSVLSGYTLLVRHYMDAQLAEVENLRTEVEQRGGRNIPG